MPLDPGSVDRSSRRHTLHYDWKTLALYALGIGATENELDYLYEGQGPKAYPSFAMVPNYPVMQELLEICQGPYDKLLHGGQSVTCHAPLPPSGELYTQGRIKAIYDLRKLSQVVLETETRMAEQLIYTTEWQMIFLGEGGFGGPRRPKVEIPKVPARDADWRTTEAIPKTQALLYRLSGDYNPLHVDPAVAREVGFDAPILHGLCTFGYVCRAVVRESCAGDAARLRTLSAQFKKPVWPGEELTTEGYIEGNRVVVQSFTPRQPDPVLGSSWADLVP